MQIRKQLRANVESFAYPIVVKRDDGTMVNINGPLTPPPMGYAGIHSRIRFKARSRNHGTKPGQSGRKQ